MGSSSSSTLPILIVGATGQLGVKLTEHALNHPNITVSILVRDRKKISDLARRVEEKGGRVIEADITKPETVKDVTKGIHTVVTALYGMETFYEGQNNLLQDAVKNGVKRFVPSEFGFPYETLQPGDHPVIDPKIKFRAELLKTNIKGVFIVNGFIMETFLAYNGDFGYWGDESLRQDLTCYDDIAKFTIQFLSHPNKSGTIKIRGDKLTVPEMAAIYSKVTGKDMKAKNNGSLEDLKNLIENLKKAGEFGKAIGLGFFYLIFQEKYKFKNADNNKFKNIKARTFEEFLSESHRP